MFSQVYIMFNIVLHNFTTFHDFFPSLGLGHVDPPPELIWGPAKTPVRGPLESGDNPPRRRLDAHNSQVIIWMHLDRIRRPAPEYIKI